MSMHSTRVTLASIVLALGLAWPAPATAHDFAAPTSSTIRYDEPEGRFKGRVLSARNSCERRRTVRLVKQTAEGSRVVGSDRSNERGRWRISRPNANGSFHVVVARRSYTDPEHVHVCERGLSATIVVNP